MDDRQYSGSPKFKGGTRECDCCSTSWPPPQTEFWHLCMNCDFGMCDACFRVQQARNPGHPIRRVVCASTMSAILPMHNTISSVQDVDLSSHHEGSPNPWRCCFTCFNYAPDFISADWNESNGGVWISARRPPISDFRVSATRGCEVCSLVYRGLAKAIPDAIEANSTIDLWVFRRKITVWVDKRSCFPNYIEFHTMPGFTTKWDTLLTRNLLSRSLSDQECFDTIRKWLTVCETSHSHPKCRQSPESVLPRRVITIGGSIEVPTLHLYETHDATGKYVALSHCWGEFKGCQSTSDNLADRVRGIEFESLPQTFKDAVLVALHLGIPYLWIDSLCILQDDRTDWETESAKMSSVYSNAYLVIAAASAAADTIGFLRAPPSLYRGVGLESTEGSGTDDIIIHTPMPHSGSLDHPAPLSPVSSGPLGNRAWTLQETLLARRCIGFNENEIAWECHSNIDCECGKTNRHNNSTIASKSATRIGNGAFWAYGASHGGLEGGGGSGIPQSHPRPLTRLNDEAITYMEWRMMIVPNYSRRSLTLAHDKLPALSALAKIIAESSGDEYIAGIWGNDINIGLAWRVRRTWKDTLLISPSTMTGPSFSWVSVEGTIEYHLPAQAPDSGKSVFGSVKVDVIGYETELSGPNRFGAIQGGWLKISALSHKFKIQWDFLGMQYTITTIESHHHPNRLRFHPDTLLEKIVITGNDNRQYTSVQRATSKDRIQYSFEALVHGVLLLDVPHVKGYRLPYDDRSGSFQPHEFAIVILGSISAIPERFQRIGLATISFQPDVAEVWLEDASRKEFTIM